MSRLLWVALFVSAAVVPASAQVTYPNSPDEYAVTLRYRIRATGEQRIVPFDAMTKHLKAIGFKHADEKRYLLDELDPAAEIATGTLPSKSVGKLFDDASIKTAVLLPVGSKQLEDPEKAVPVRIELATGLPNEEQQLLHAQAVGQLEKLGFTQSTGYDHRGYTRVRGSMPAGQVPSLVKDLRSLPPGWFVGGADRFAQSLPLRGVLPVRTVEVLPDLPATGAAPAPANGGKLTADLKAIVDDKAAAEKPLVVEAVLERDTSAEPAGVRRALKAVLTGMAVEGLVGNVVTIRLPRAALATRVAELPEVRHVRLPRVGTETVVAGDAKPADVLAESRLKRLHALGYDGTGVTVAVLGSEFPGLKVTEEKPARPNDPPPPPVVELAGEKLPVGSRLIDLTAELRPTLDPAPADPARGPGGTAAALAVHAAAPNARVLLVRVDPTRFHQLLSVAKVVVGEATVSPAMFTRGEELSVRTALLESQRRIVTAEVERAFADLTGEPVPRKPDDPNPDDPKPDDPPQVKRRLLASKALKQLKADTAAHNLLLARYLGLEGMLERVRGASVVVNTLVWETGHPHDGQSELARLIESRYATGGKLSALQASKQPPTPAWVQAAGVGVGSVWSGPFRDTDGKRLLQFTDGKRPLPAGRWTNEFAFLGYSAGGGKPAALPAGLKLRITMQWREPHRPDVLLPVEPSHDLRLRLFRQLDPTGQQVATDELVEVAASSGEPVRLLKTPGSGVYEVTLSTTLPAEGAYALRVEGGLAKTSLPPSARLDSELSPRIVLELTDPAQAAKGRVVFDTDAVQRSGVGIPGDSLAAVTVGTADTTGVTSATGVGPGVALGTKPELLSEGAITWAGGGATGTGVAAGYLGGAAACLMQAGVRPSDLVKTIGLKAGDRFVLPEAWLKSLSPAK